MGAVYLDHAATTPMHPAVIDEMTRIMTTIYGNPSSIHQFGRQAEFELVLARDTVAEAINAKSDEIIFNSGGTEADNTVLIQTALNRQQNGKHIITTSIEHSAVAKSMAYLEEHGFQVTYLPVDSTGKISMEQVASALRDDTILVSIMYGNNEIGTINPIKEIGELLSTHQALFHTDAVQAFGTQLIDVKDLQVDYLSVSGHKINGPKGTGFLYIKEGAFVPVMLYGGDQEEKKRAGTENVLGIVGMAKAVTLITDEAREQKNKQYREFKQIIMNNLLDNSIDFEINGDLENSLPHILNIWLKGIPNNLILSNLDLKGFAISTGSACTAGNVKPSRIIQQIRPQEPAAAGESIRISFGYGNTAEEVATFSQELAEIISKLH
ncbi:cysteine desulfurase family protein [Vagococcus vulneris]|uniref:cysteine desulfurase n=1 Tax=Vagococcus vulneris TaxID=1977869 RepID=A0A429ZZB0_9ENTE|nr:cysteine desulfurase family protein [Vagococcus vulneris]RST99334.1 cysteine desulfurase NifS [Vagococcus vulneris]